MNRRNLLAITLAWAAASALAPFGAYAQSEYPTKPIRVIVPFAPGGVVDTIARLWAHQAGPMLGTILVAVYATQGLFGAKELALSALLGVPYLLGVAIGAYFFRGTSDQTYRRLAYAIIALSALLSLPVLDPLFR